MLCEFLVSRFTVEGSSGSQVEKHCIDDVAHHDLWGDTADIRLPAGSNSGGMIPGTVHKYRQASFPAGRDTDTTGTTPKHEPPAPDTGNELEK